MQVKNTGSKSQSVLVEIEGVPARGIVDTGSDITIIGGELFKHVATMARLQKQQLKPPDKSPLTYNQQPFSLDGRMDLCVSFGEKDILTPYISRWMHSISCCCQRGCADFWELLVFHDAVQSRKPKLKKTLTRKTRQSTEKLGDNTTPRVQKREVTEPSPIETGYPPAKFQDLGQEQTGDVGQGGFGGATETQRNEQLPPLMACQAL